MLTKLLLITEGVFLLASGISLVLALIFYFRETREGASIPKKVKVFGVLTFVFLTIGFSVGMTEPVFWHDTQKANDINAYRFYLLNRPHGLHAGEAQSHLNTLVEEYRAFCKAKIEALSSEGKKDCLGSKILDFMGKQPVDKLGTLPFALEEPGAWPSDWGMPLYNHGALIRDMTKEIKDSAASLAGLAKSQLAESPANTPPFNSLTLHCKYNISPLGFYQSEKGGKTVTGLTAELIYSIYLPGKKTPESSHSFSVVPEERLKSYGDNESSMNSAIEENLLSRLRKELPEKLLWLSEKR